MWLIDVFDELTNLWFFSRSYCWYTTIQNNYKQLAKNWQTILNNWSVNRTFMHARQCVCMRVCVCSYLFLLPIKTKPMNSNLTNSMQMRFAKNNFNKL